MTDVLWWTPAVAIVIAAVSLSVSMRKQQSERPRLRAHKMTLNADPEVFHEQVGRDNYGRPLLVPRRRRKATAILTVHNQGGSDVTLEGIRLFVPTTGSRGYSLWFDGGERISARDRMVVKLGVTGLIRDLRSYPPRGWHALASSWRHVSVTFVTADGQEFDQKTSWTVRSMIEWARSLEW
ncbi:hypothetical protein [Microbacterium sp. zg.Y909]|uniref:hypothetical protein n=1 Tax=Microbacterium sp. zg.Y909 TaxID=2969413 RepID=UPI00214C9D71|nr:hypothetical protein [Microbacterium sp. zg.Y909]MCR2825014.1 hypothetical protein [Microbacterium sp. zg.Y909]